MIHKSIVFSSFLQNHIYHDLPILSQIWRMWFCVCNCFTGQSIWDNHRLSSELASEEMLDIATAPLQQLW
jgi:hypothetical protein